MNAWRRRITVISITVLISACSVSSRQNEFSNNLEYPLKTQTRATNFLSCFGDMLSTYRTTDNSVSPLKVAIVNVKDATNVSSFTYPDSEIPNNFTDMTLGLVSRIGGPIRVSHIPASEEILDAARYKSVTNSSSLGAYEPTHYRSDTIQMYGALTEYDRITDNKKQSAEGAFEFGSGSGETNLEVSASKIKNVARMTMDFRIAHASIGDVVNNSSSTNTVQVYQRGNDLSFGLSIDGNSIGYSTERSVVDARHKAIRLLVEWGVVEALGRYAYVPYWKCLPNSDNPKQLGFKDLVSSGGSFYNFQTINRNASDRKLPRKSSDLIDMRDKLLINAVLSDFNNAEYLKNKARRLIKRRENNTTLIQRSVVGGKTVETKSTIVGKSTLRRDILQQYRRDKNYAKLSDSALLKRLHNQFVKAKILSPKDNMLSGNTYLALWLNVPIIKGARWRK